MTERPMEFELFPQDNEICKGCPFARLREQSHNSSQDRITISKLKWKCMVARLYNRDGAVPTVGEIIHELNLDIRKCMRRPVPYNCPNGIIDPFSKSLEFNKS